MTSSRVFAGTTVALGLVALVHAAVTWPTSATLALFGGGALVAFLAEAVVVNLGWLEHHVGPKSSASTSTCCSGGRGRSTSRSGSHSS